MAQSFIFSNDPGSGFSTYDELKRRQEIVKALAAQSLSRSPRNVGEGLTAIGRALAYRFGANDLAGKEAAANSKMNSIIGGLLAPGASPAAAPTPASPNIPTEALSSAPMSGTAAPLSGGTVAPSGGGGGDYAKAISSLESEGSGGYSALGPVVKNGDRAYGKYQVMGANIPEWTKEALGVSMTPEQFLNDPKAQDAVFKAKFGSYVQKYGPEGAAKAWFAGEGGMNNPNARDVTGTSVAQYAKGFLNALGPSQAQAAEAPAQALAFNGKPVNANPLANMSAFAPQAAPQPAPVASPVAQALTQRFTPAAGPAPTITNVPTRPVQLPIAGAGPAPAPGGAAPAVDPRRAREAQAIRGLMSVGTPEARSLANALLQDYLKPQNFGFQTVPDGTIVRTDSRAGTVTPVYQGAQKPVTLGQGATLVDPKTGRVIAGGAPQPPKVVEFYDEKTGQPYKAEFNTKTGQYERVGGTKAPNGMQLKVGPNGEVQFQQGAGIKPFTESQSKDIGFATRAAGALPTIDAYGDALTNLGEKVGGSVPVVGNYMKSEEFQKAEQAGKEFLQAILRKDTGAAITAEETAEYGSVYLPQPGDSKGVLEQKKIARRRALLALKLGLPPTAILQLEQAGVDMTPTQGAATNPSPNKTQNGVQWSVE